MGDCPFWYPLMRAAKYMGVPPWDLADRPIVWQQWANIAEKAEAEARRQLQQAEELKQQARMGQY